MKAILTTTLFLVIASAHFSFAQTETKQKEQEILPIDTSKGVVTRTYRFTFNSKIGVNLGVYNFWETTRNLSQAVNLGLPAARRFGIGFNYFGNAVFNNRHWTGINLDLISNFERSQNGYSVYCLTGNAMAHYGINVKSKSSDSPLFPYVAFGFGATTLYVNSNAEVAASNLTSQFTSINLTSRYLSYKVGIASMTINKKGYPSSIVQLGYLGGINDDRWTSGNYGKVTGLKAFALSGVFLGLTY